MSTLEKLLQEQCPDGVECRPLKEVCKSLKKGTLTTSDLIESGEYPVINSGRDLYGHYDKFNNEDAITIAARGEYAGFVNYFAGKFWAGGLCYPYTSNDKTKLSNKFLFYYLKSIERKIMNTIVARGSIPALNKSDVDKLLIPVPPLPIQQEIVRILDKFTKLTAELTAELTARQKQYEYYRDKLLTFKQLSDTTDAQQGEPK